REEWKKIMQKCELKSKLEKDRVKVSSWKSLRKFNEFGGFLPNTFIGGDSIYFRGQDKNVIIQKLLYLKDNNLQNHKCDFKDFSYLKNRIIKFGEINENTKYNSGT
ncbi:MAG: hypothetical protein QGI60_02915, partial [archaeon]|nr:hypothetical protein [archaeon]